MDEGPLEALENLLKSNFGDLVVSLAVSTKGSLFLSAWQQPSELSSTKISMEYLPIFYLIAAVHDDLKLSLKLISYHGVVIDDLQEKDQCLTDEEKICFIKRLVNMKLCLGVQISDELNISSSSHLTEKLEQNILIRSRHCNFGLDDGRNVCEACKNFAKEMAGSKNKKLRQWSESSTAKQGLEDVSLSSNIFPSSPISTINNDPSELSGVGVEEREVEEGTQHKEEKYIDMETADKLLEQADSLISNPPLSEKHKEAVERERQVQIRKSKKTGSKKLRLRRATGDILGPFLCDQCGETFTYADELNRHLDETFHQSKETAICFQCGDILDSRISFRKHLWLHENFRPYKCRYCDFTSTVKDHVFNQHAIYIHKRVGSEDDVELLYDIMEQIDDYEQDNNLHLGPPLTKNRTRRVRKAKKRKLECSVGRLQHSCSQPNCHMRYQSYKDLKRHYQETGHRAKHECFLCGEVAPRDVYLRNHIISVHLELKPYQCKHCSFTSALPDKIYNGHYKRIHGEGKVGTKQDVVAIPEVLKVIGEFEKVNQANLLGISMMPPPLEELVCKMDTDNDSEAPESCSPAKRKNQLSDPYNASNIKLEAFEEPTGPSYDSDTLGHFSAPKNDDVKPFEIQKYLDTPVKDKIKKVSGKFRQQCDICLFAFDSKDSFENDQEKHKQQLANREVVNCPTCAVSMLKVDLNEHYTRDHSELKAGCCLECLIVVIPRIKMQRHFVTIHKPKNLCPICGKHFRVVKDHMAVKHSNNAVKDHICEVCGKKFRHALLLQSHVAKMHTARKSFPCKFCGQLFKEKCTLTTHYWSMHMKVKPYKVSLLWHPHDSAQYCYNLLNF